MMDRRDFNRSMAAAAGLALTGGSVRADTPLRVRGERLLEHIRALGAIGKTDGGAQRVAYSDADLAARRLAMTFMREAQLDVAVDTAGNIRGRRPGTDPTLRPILFGSHIDSVPNGGDYDGPLGSLGAIEVAQVLAESGTRTRHPLEVVIFQNEEGGLYGSKAMAGLLTERDLEAVSHSGRTIREGIGVIGGDVSRLAEARREVGSIAGYFELHIEQGGTLEQQGRQVGVVQGIVGIWHWDVTITGFANHAGTTPMDMRQDALLSGARFVQAVNDIVRAEPGRQVGTVGRIEAVPGAPNVVPGEVRLTLEMRDLDPAKVTMLADRIQAAAREIGVGDGTTFTFRKVVDIQPAPTDTGLRDLVRDSARALELSTLDMPSGAGHDAQSMARIGPAAMMFIPSVGGISHSPREFSHPADLINGADVLLGAVLAADRALER